MTEIAVGVSNAGPASERAVRWAAEHAADLGARLRLVHVVDRAIEATGDAELLLTAQTSARDSLEAARATAESVAPGLDVTTDLQQGRAEEVFEQISKSVDLLVVATDWHGGRRPSRRGVHSLRIAAASQAPVAVIPDVDLSAREGVVVGVDGSPEGARALEFAAREAERIGEPLIAVHAWDIAVIAGGEYGYGVAMVGTDELSQAAEELLDEALEPIAGTHPGVEVVRRVITGDPVTALADEAADAKMLVVGSHGRGPLARFLLGSVSHGVLSHLEAPTVVVR
ncbi:universal stress protein [Agromyces aerolatus]|uniref:universal stress protein n=1 Tax=Agromyces sp. LY-1074 TaxID=3074080 RepID=UPI0028626095|nr:MULTISPECIES: universal stress protein [unclassified Agromyces]MDR5701486.1 universal stress protein [Agromyces sp. LY-1074]MDR5704447.1 universal stress protein [Agromyces sp. LY-1358]